MKAPAAAIVTDKLRSHGVAQRRLLPGVGHRQSRYLKILPRTHIGRRDGESDRCNGSNRSTRHSTFVRSRVHPWPLPSSPTPIAAVTRSGQWLPMSGSRRHVPRAQHNMRNIVVLPLVPPTRSKEENAFTQVGNALHWRRFRQSVRPLSGLATWAPARARKNQGTHPEPAQPEPG
jgi:hypothetical protein